MSIEIFKLRREQYMLMEDRSRRAFYSLLTLCTVIGYLLFKDSPTLLVPIVSVEVDGIFAVIFGPAALILANMNYHYLNAFEHIARERCVNQAMLLQDFSNNSREELLSMIRRHSLPGKVNLYSTTFSLEKPERYAHLQYPLWFISESFWICIVMIYNAIPFLIIGWASYSLYHSEVDQFIRVVLVTCYAILGIGSVFAIPFWFARIREDMDEPHAA